MLGRKSKYLICIPVQSKHSKIVSNAIIKRLEILNAPIKTITFDNGTEFADHETIAKKLNTKIYFAHPYCSWQRGLNEATNGFLREFIPKKTDLTKLNPMGVIYAQSLINNRPRKALNYKKPVEAMIESHFSNQVLL